MKNISNQKEELKVSGSKSADGTGETTITCKNCWTQYDFLYAKNRTVGSWCNAYYEYECPSCKNWNRAD